MQGRYAKLVLWYEFPTSSIYLTCYISYWRLICTSVHELPKNSKGLSFFWWLFCPSNGSTANARFAILSDYNYSSGASWLFSLHWHVERWSLTMSVTIISQLPGTFACLEQRSIQ
jgi:hypothetical protein